MLPGDSPRAINNATVPVTPVTMGGSRGVMSQQEGQPRPALKTTTNHDELRPKPDREPASPTSGRIMRDVPTVSPKPERSPSTSPFRLPMPYITPGQLAFSAMQFLPVPLLVLDNLKTVVLANEAMGRLLGLMADPPDSSADEQVSVMERLKGQTLSQVGIDMIQDGRPVWITWENFLDSLVQDMGTGKMTGPRRRSTTTDGIAGDDTTPTGGIEGVQSSRATHHPSPNAVVEVVVSRKDLNRSTWDARAKSKASDFQSCAKMIITVWEVDEHQTYFTLTFTNSETSTSSLAAPRKSVARPNVLEAAERRTISSSNPPSASSSHESSSPSYRASPSSVSLSSSPFPPMGPPSRSSISSTPSILQKLTMMKDALLDNTEQPILATWKDGSVMFPNRAARVLFQRDVDMDKSGDGFDALWNWEVWDEHFTRRLDPSEYPIAVLIRTETPYAGLKIGMYDKDGNKLVLDALGEVIRDDNTGEFLAGVVTCRDVTQMSQMITQIKEADEERFRLICDTMPQLVWTTTPDGMHDFFNDRWYNYTGLSKEDSLGLGWKNPVHPDDMEETQKRWKHSLETGEEYVVEYRCRSKEGEWRWVLGRALPFRNKETGKIEKWFGKSGHLPVVWSDTYRLVRHLHRCTRVNRDKAGGQANETATAQRHCPRSSHDIYRRHATEHHHAGRRPSLEYERRQDRSS